MKITVKQYMEILSVASSKLDEIDKDVKVLSIIYNKPVKEIESINFGKLKKLVNRVYKEIGVIKEFKHKEYLFTTSGIYKALVDVTDENNCFGQYKDVKYLMEHGGIEKNLHKLLACVYRPLNWRLKPKPYTAKTFNRVSKKMLNMNVRKVFGAVFFYSKTLSRLMLLTEVCLDEAKRTIEEAIQEASTPS